MLSITIEGTVIKVSDTFQYNLRYSHKDEQCMSVPKIVMESITHLYDCTLGCNGEYRSSYDYLRL
jgi:hypothetical protein